MSERLGSADVLCAAAKRYEQQEAQLLGLYDRAYDLIVEEGEIECLTSEQTDGPWIISMTREEEREEGKIVTRIYIRCVGCFKRIPPKYDKCTSVYCEWRPEKEGRSSPWNRLAELKVSTKDGTKRCTFKIVERDFCEDEMIVDYSEEIVLISAIMSQFLETPKTSD